MATRRMPSPYFGIAGCVVLVLSMSGCDYWPPALQTQIEQLRSENQALAMEKTQLQSQVDELSRARQDLQSQFDELNRVNREKTNIIANLQHQVDAVRTKSAKATTGVKKTAKTTTKSSAKKPVRKTTRRE